MQVALATSVVGISLALYVWSFGAQSTDSPNVGAAEPWRPPSPEQLASARPRRTIDTKPAESAIAEFRQRQLSLEPRSQPAQHIATSGLRVARLADDKLIVVEPTRNKEPLEFSLPGAHAVTPISGGLMAAGEDRVLVLKQGDRAPTSYPRPTVFPGSRILPDLIEPGRLWVHHPQNSHLYGYTLSTESDQLLPLAQVLELKGPESRAFLPLRDGSFVYFTGHNWLRIFTQGRRFEFESPKNSSIPFRTLRAARIDQFFILYQNACVERVQLQDRLRVVSTRQLAELPIDITSSENRLILLRAQRRQPQGLDWSLEVLNETGTTRSIELGPSAPDSFHGDWVARQLEPRGLAASSSWVVVGGSQRVRVWDIKTTELVFDSSG